MTNSQRTQPKANDLRGILLRIYPFGAWVTSCHRPFCQRVVGQWFVLCSIVCFFALHPAVSRIERTSDLYIPVKLCGSRQHLCLTNVICKFPGLCHPIHAFPSLVHRSSNQDRSCRWQHLSTLCDGRLESHCQDSLKIAEKACTWTSCISSPMILFSSGDVKSQT